MRRTKAQIAVVMVLLIAILLIAIAGTYLIGETGFSRIRLANTADATMISGTSEFCRNLNQIPSFQKRLKLNWWTLQAQLILHGVFWGGKWEAYAYVYKSGMLWGLLESKNIFDQAKASVANTSRDYRIRIVDGILGGGLIDEPKPFSERASPGAEGAMTVFNKAQALASGVDPCEDYPTDTWDEIGRDAKGHIIWIDYARFNFRDPRFTCQYRKWKDALQVAAADTWYKKTTYKYLYNKYLYEVDQAADAGDTKPLTMVRTERGRLQVDGIKYRDGNVEVSPPADSRFDSSVALDLANFPSNVSISAQFGVVFFLYQSGSGAILPGVFPDPWMWIRKVSFGSRTPSITVTKKTPYKRLPFFSNIKEVELSHTSKVSINGGPDTGWDYTLKE